MKKFIFFTLCIMAPLIHADDNSIIVQNYVNDLNFIITVLNGGEIKKTVPSTPTGSFGTVVFEGLNNGAHTITIEREQRPLDPLRAVAAYMYSLMATPQPQRILVKKTEAGVEECGDKLIWSEQFSGTHVVIQLHDNERKIVASFQKRKQQS